MYETSTALTLCQCVASVLLSQSLVVHLTESRLGVRKEPTLEAVVVEVGCQTVAGVVERRTVAAAATERTAVAEVAAMEPDHRAVLGSAATEGDCRLAGVAEDHPDHLDSHHRVHHGPGWPMVLRHPADGFVATERVHRSAHAATA